MHRALLIAAAAASLGGCATARDSASLDGRDPYERFNRGVWGFNQAVDRAAVRPVTTAYRAVVPGVARRGISRVFANLTEPLSFVNNLLQGKPNRAANSLGRFVVNSTVGIGGLSDPATKMGLKDSQEDFGQTLATWGAKKSPYLVLPLLGPSTVRDAVGTVVHRAADPLGIVLSEVGAGTAETIGANALRVVDGRSQAIDSGGEAVLESSADPYAAARSAYFQRREAQIADSSERIGDSGDADDELQRALDENATTPPAGAPQPEPQQDDTTSDTSADFSGGNEEMETAELALDEEWGPESD